MDIAVLIPAYKPDAKLLDLLHSLCESEVPRIVVVNDGSPDQFDEIFRQVQELAKVDMLTHPKNLGKGAAMKTGFRYLEELPEKYMGVVTADADGQHTVADILMVARQTLANPHALTLGGRRFDQDVPWKSMYGNTITRWVLRLLFGIGVYDTQTGLRGIPRQLIPFFIDIPYDRYEYELEMLLVCQRRMIPMDEVEIKTVYFDENKASHFRPWTDSRRVYTMLLRYGLVWIVTWLIDLLVFALGSQFVQPTLAFTLLTRLSGLGGGYILAQKWIFKSRAEVDAFLPRFAVAALALSLLSAVLVPILQARFGLTAVQAKVRVEVFVLAAAWFLQKASKQWILLRKK